MIRRTERKDIPAIMSIIVEAKKSMKSLGISQWQNGYPNEEAFLSDIENGVSYVLEEQGKIVATAAIMFGVDPTYQEIYEGEWKTEGEYGVLHRIAVKEGCKREGYAEKLVEFAGQKARDLGIGSLRVDTHEGNLPMRSFLKKQGFEECGNIYLAEEKTAENKRIAYEKALLA